MGELGATNTRLSHSEPTVRLWRQACEILLAPNIEETYTFVERQSPSDNVWHSLSNCIAYQADLWMRMLQEGADDAMQPAAFKLAIVLRHTPADLVISVLGDLLKNHPQSQDLTAYILALITDDEVPDDPNSPPSAAPLRDLQLYGDCELAVLASTTETYARHSGLVRAEYDHMAEKSYLDLRVKILNQLLKIPRLFRTVEFEGLERAARDNIEAELRALRLELNKKN